MPALDSTDWLLNVLNYTPLVRNPPLHIYGNIWPKQPTYHKTQGRRDWCDSEINGKEMIPQAEVILDIFVNDLEYEYQLLRDVWEFIDDRKIYIRISICDICKIYSKNLWHNDTKRFTSINIRIYTI